MHGARSRRQVAAKARNIRRAFVRRLGVRASDLDAITSGYLHSWALAKARVDLYDDSDVTSRNALTAANSELRALKALEARLRELGLVAGRSPRDPGAGLRAHVESTYRANGSGPA